MDFDNDGNVDILSGCYWTDGSNEGQIQILRGDGQQNFTAAESITNSAGETLCNLEVAEDAEQEYDMRNICTQQHAVDYDGDGDLDLVTGCISTEFFWFENTSENGTPDFARLGEPLDIVSPQHHSSPHLVDWDGDGDLDLLSGTSLGGAIFSENVGTRSEPKWAKFKQLIPGCTLRELLPDSPARQGPGQSTRVWAVDWNADGLLDLVIGDCVTLVQPKDGITQAEFERRQEGYQTRMTEISQERQKMVESFGEDFDYANITEEQQEKLSSFGTRFSEVYESRSEYMDSQATGRVWLLIRKPKSDLVDQLAVD